MFRLNGSSVLKARSESWFTGRLSVLVSEPEGLPSGSGASFPEFYGNRHQRLLAFASTEFTPAFCQTLFGGAYYTVRQYELSFFRSGAYIGTRVRAGR